MKAAQEAQVVSTRLAWSRRVAVGVVTWVAAVVVLCTVGAGVASAHAFLVGSDPAQGARLAQAPATITLVFSEKVVTSATRVTVRLAGSGRAVATTVEQAANGDTVRVRLGARPDGVYVVSWQDLSAEDGHTAFGEFAFGAGTGSGAVPSARQGGAAPDPVRVAATVLFLVGLALAAGGAVTGLLVDRSVTARSGGVRVGLVAATGGAVVQFVDEVAGQAPGLSHPALLAGVAALLAAGSMFAAGVSRRLAPVLLGLVGEGVVWAADGHPALVGGVLGFVVNAVHLVVGTVWVGTLGYLLVAVVRYRSDSGRLWAVAGRYARVALPLVVVLAAAGGLSAFEALPSWASLFSSGYGQLIVVKTVLFAVALGLALWSRRRGIGGRRRSVLARAVPVEAAIVAVILVVTAVLANTGPPARAVSVAALLGPAPLSGPVARAAGLAGQLDVSVAAGAGQLQIQVEAPNGPTIDATASIDAFYPDGRDIGLFPRTCGGGCFAQALTLPPGLTSFHIVVAAHGWQGGTWVGTINWPPPPDDPGLLAALVARMDLVQSVGLTETVTSNTRSRSYTSTGPTISGRQLMALEPYAGGDPDQPAASGGITDVQPLTVGGPGLQLYLPGTPVWATLWLDRHGRLARDRLVDLGHVITDTFHYPTGSGSR